MDFILSMIIVLLFTKVAGHLSVLLKQPAVLGKLLVGIVIGPALLGWVNDGPLIQQFAEIGVLLLMFMAGLETDLDQLRKNWKPACAVALAGIILPFSGVFLVGELFDLGFSQSLFLGVLFSATSVSITVQVLKELNKMDTKESATILGAAVIDDVLVVILFAVIMSFFGTGDSGRSSIGLLIAKKGLFFAVVFIVGWLVVPKVLEWYSKLKITEPVISISLIICFAFAYFGEMLGMAGIIGAFAAGLAISQTAFKHTIEKRIEPISYAVFVPIFFVSIGLNVSFDGVMNQIWLLILLTIVAVLTKLFGGAIGARLTGNSYKSSLAIGSGMVSRGEVALIIAATGLQSGLLRQEYYTTIIFSIILTTLIAPPLLKIFFQHNSSELLNQKNIYKGQ
ncbi:cation:proton antiporter [Bacillus sp. CRN 9]|nr:cation:proton antiporter [Bacillus sp. CRN 9]